MGSLDKINKLKPLISQEIPPLSKDIIFLWSSQLIWQFSAGMMGVFLPIFLFSFFEKNLEKVFFFYIFVFFVSALFLPLGTKIGLNFLGIKKSLIFSIPLLSFYYFCFYLLDKENYYFILILAAFLVAFFRSFYWTPYHVDFLKFSQKNVRGRQFALFSASLFLVGVVAPFTAGLIIKNFSLKVLFLISSIIVFFSIFPLLKIKKTQERFSFGYFQTFKTLFSKKFRKFFVGLSAIGAEEAVGTIVWPIFIFEILKGDHFAVGEITAIVVASSMFLYIITGKYTDKIKDKREFFKPVNYFYSLGWVLKSFVNSAFQIFAVNTYHSFMAILRGVPFGTFIYEMMADSGHYVDEYTALREIALNIGRVLILFLCVILSSIFKLNINWIFLITAFVSLVINLF